MKIDDRIDRIVSSMSETALLKAVLGLRRGEAAGGFEREADREQAVG